MKVLTFNKKISGISVQRMIVLIISIGGLSGCAFFAPRYQITHRYEPPTDPAASICLEKCTQRLESCQQSCTSTYQACLKRIEPLVEERYKNAMQRYENELETYRRHMNSRYLGWGRATLGWGRSAWGWGGYPWGWGGSPWGWGGPYYGLGYSYPFYYQPAPPTRPSRTREFDRLRYEQCEVECGCQSVQDSCFLSCGGRKIVEERCIANCP
ncbi:hypothetical protein [Nitrosovibrio sp. Nv6]|uniref:hypothetical protein n=1 Tax=Nitrosovibrio sp. Nv6 TaxID=1855340 RepID=UPI0008B2938C|nr:hypothetical protein [Nitrosovibrio sp. Nv6]SEP20726.1 hypothetical protein SAMN05216316_2019 [Nitrosovibrio sp. Nv6]